MSISSIQKKFPLGDGSHLNLLCISGVRTTQPSLQAPEGPFDTVYAFVGCVSGPHPLGRNFL